MNEMSPHALARHGRAVLTISWIAGTLATSGGCLNNAPLSQDSAADGGGDGASDSHDPTPGTDVLSLAPPDPALVALSGDGTNPHDCPEVLRPSVFPTFELTIAPDVWESIEDDFAKAYEDFEEDGSWPPAKKYYPIAEFRYGTVAITNALLRLKGNSSWRHTVELDGVKAKMQFVIAFNEIDPDGRFQGMRKVELDMGRNDRTFLRSRMGLAFLREDLNVAAQCANNARLVVNGTYYGLFAAIERMDKEFLQRNFPGKDDGDLWEGDDEIKTNETTATKDRVDALVDATTFAEFESHADVDASLRSWAGETMLPQADGYYGGVHNYYLYDHPDRGFIWLPYDLDACLDYRPADLNPVFWSRIELPEQNYLLVMGDEEGQERYERALCDVALPAFDVDRLRARVQVWAAQIAQAVVADPHRPFEVERWQDQIVRMQEHLAARKAFITRWCTCRDTPAGEPDADGDGTVWCRECDDTNNKVGPDADEVCGDDPALGEPADDDCDGEIDEGCD